MIIIIFIVLSYCLRKMFILFVVGKVDNIFV